MASIGSILALVISLIFLFAAFAIFDIRTSLREIYRLLWNETEGRKYPDKVKPTLLPK